MVAFFERRIFTNSITSHITAIALGLSSAILLINTMSVFDVPLSRNNLFMILGGYCGLLVLFVSIRLLKRGSLVFSRPNRHNLFETICVGGLFLLLLCVRAVQVRDIFVPNWVDGLTHTLLLQKFVSMQYIPFDRIYHTGFHSIALSVHHLWSLDLPEAVLLLGQWLSAMCGVSLYLLAKRYIHYVFPSYLCIVIYSLFLLFPSFLVSWGRYPFLLGLTLLPPAIVAALNWLDHQKGLFLAIAFVVVLFFAHYGALLIWFSFVAAHLAFTAIAQRSYSRDLRKCTSILSRLTLLVMPLLAFIAPKALVLLRRHDVITRMAQRIHDPDFGADANYAAGLLFSHDHVFLLIWLAVTFWSIRQKKSGFQVIAIWPLTLWFLIWIQYLLARISIASYSNAIIFFSVPLAISFGMVSDRVILFFRSKSLADGRIHYEILGGIACFVLITSGVILNSKIISADTVLFSAEDSRAMDWIVNESPYNSVFFIKTFRWGDELAPADGGGWIEILTGRKVVYPKSLGDLYDMCVFIRSNDVDYIYLREPSEDESFGLRLSDINGSYKIVYETETIKIVTVSCP